MQTHSNWITVQCLSPGDSGIEEISLAYLIKKPHSSRIRASRKLSHLLLIHAFPVSRRYKARSPNNAGMQSCQY
jgi:hypothetical protein